MHIRTLLSFQKRFLRLRCRPFESAFDDFSRPNPFPSPEPPVPPPSTLSLSPPPPTVVLGPNNNWSLSPPEDDKGSAAAAAAAAAVAAAAAAAGGGGVGIMEMEQVRRVQQRQNAPRREEGRIHFHGHFPQKVFRNWMMFSTAHSISKAIAHPHSSHIPV